MSAARRAAPSTDLVWDALVAGGPMTAADLAGQTGLNIDTVRHALRSLEGAGHVARRRDGTTVQWRIGAPRSAPPRLPASPQDALWRTMRALQQFTVDDLIFALQSGPLPVSEALGRAYTQALLAAGYLRVLVKSQPSRGIPARYQLVRDTGPLPPKVERRQVVRDQNEDRVLHVKGAQL